MAFLCVKLKTSLYKPENSKQRVRSGIMVAFFGLLELSLSYCFNISNIIGSEGSAVAQFGNREKRALVTRFVPTNTFSMVFFLRLVSLLLLSTAGICFFSNFTVFLALFLIT